MTKIHQLPEHIIAQIAAGEVIERPAYAVKELVENAIDAHATSIQIIIENAGLKKIVIIDNGEGMEKEDVLLSYKHHTTSKLDANLTGIKTLGFRGEALSSIAAISNMIIKSKTAAAAAGTQIELKAGQLMKQSPVGMPAGTSITIENLFSTVPVRKKFLRSMRTELRKVVDFVLQTAIAYPTIRFELMHNDRTLLNFPPETAANERITYLFGTDIFSHMLPLNYENGYIQLKGFIAKPHITSSSTNKQYVYINNRPVAHALISQSVKDAFGSILDTDAFPIFILFLFIPAEMIDINIHPRKEHIAFMDNTSVMQAIKTAVGQMIENNNLTYLSQEWRKAYSKQNMPEHAAGILREQMQTWDIPNFARLLSSSDTLQVHNLYIFIQTYNGFMVIDQHAAHERILYEKFLVSFHEKKQNQKQFILPKPLHLGLSMTEYDMYKTHVSALTSFGFSTDIFGKDTIVITAVPEFFKDHTIPQLFRELLENTNQGKTTDVDVQSMKMLAFLACRSAIKAGDKLTKKQMKALLKELHKTPNNYTCPHGRPIKMEIDLHDIHKFFKRA